MIVGDAAAFLADEPGHRLVVLHLRGGVGPVAQLVLEPLQVHAVAGAVGQDARQQEAGQATGGLREHQEHVAHGRGREPLVPGEQVTARTRAPIPRHGHRAGGVGADVGAALLLGHRHAGDQAALASGRPQPRVVGGGRQQRLEPLRQRGRVPQGGNDRVRHRDRAAVPRLGAAPQVELRGPGHVRTRAGVPPRRGVHPGADGHVHQLVPGRVELDLVDAVAEPVVGAQHGRVLVGQPAPVLRLGGAGAAADLADLRLRPAGALAAQRVQHGRVVGYVVPGQRRGLVEDLVRRRHRRLLGDVSDGREAGTGTLRAGGISAGRAPSPHHSPMLPASTAPGGGR